MALNDEAVRRLPLAGQKGAPKGKAQYTVADGDTPGFFVLVGTRDVTFCAQIETEKNGARTSQRVTLGRFYVPKGALPKLTVKEARAMALDRRGGILTERIKIVRSGVTLRAAWAAYKLYLQRQKRSAGTIWHYGDAIERSLSEWLDKPLKWLCDHPEAVRKKYDTIIEQVIAKRAPSGRGQANERGVPRAQGVMRVLSAVYGYAQDKLDRSLPERSPVTACDMVRLERRQTGLAAIDLASWAVELDGRRSVNPIRAEFHLFIALSGARPAPIRVARWSDFDWRRRVLKVTEDKTRAIDIPLSWAMVRCLQRARRAARVLFPGSEWLWPAQSASGHIENSQEDRDKLSKFGNDLRQSMATLSSDVGVSELHLKVMMGHSIKGDVTMGYINRSKLDERRLRASQERVSRYLVHHLRLPFDAQRMRPRAVWDGATW